MLFDIRGRRRSVVKGVYGGLALLFLLGFVGFGVDSDVGVGLFGSGHGGGSARGHGGGGDAGSLEDQIEDAREATERNPRDAAAWRRLSVLEGSAAYEQTGGHGGGTQLADDASAHLNLAVDAYEKYLEAAGQRRVDRTVAASAARSYAALGRTTEAVAAQRRAIGRREAQGWFLLAQYAAADKDDRLVDRALDRAISLAPRGQRAALRAQRAALRQQAFTVLGPGAGGAPPSGGHGG